MTLPDGNDDNYDSKLRADTAMTTSNNNGVLQWSEIDKVKFYGIGTVMYSALTLMLHPITVLKTRQQVLNTSGNPNRTTITNSSTQAAASSSKTSISNTASLQHQPSFRATLRDAFHTNGVRGLFRGVGIVVALAVPARIIYIGVLENTRHELHTFLVTKQQQQQEEQQERERLVLQSYGGPEEAHSTLSFLAGKKSPSTDDDDNHDNNNNSNTSSSSSSSSSSSTSWIASVAGGLAGGVAAVSAQILVVPMDVISQKQIVMNPQQYTVAGSASSVVKNVLRAEGYKGLYRGFGLSMFNSLPAGSLWWATYSGCQHWIQPHVVSNIVIPRSSDGAQNTATASTGERGNYEDTLQRVLRQGVSQTFAGISAAIVAATLTQPLDVVKTRLQVGTTTSASPTPPNTATALQSLSALSIAQELVATSGIRGFFRGLGPRILHMGLWGTVLSSAYEVLRHVSRKDDDDI